jgi:hypothetical protein
VPTIEDRDRIMVGTAQKSAFAHPTALHPGYVTGK